MRGRFRRHGSLHDDQRQLAAQRSVVRAAVSRPSLARPPFPALRRRMLLQTGRARASGCSPVREHSSRTAGGRVLRRVLRPACRCCVAARSRPHRPVRPPLCEPLSHVAPVPSAAAEEERETYAEEVVAGVLAVKVSLAVSLDVGDVELLELADRGEHCRCGTYFRPGPG